jgi:hypothetical protein
MGPPPDDLAADTVGLDDYPAPRPRLPAGIIAIGVACVVGVVLLVVVLMSANPGKNEKPPQAQAQVLTPEEMLSRQPDFFRQSMSVFSFMMSFYCVLTLLYLATLCLFVTWVARDARNRGVNDSVFWIFLVLMAHVLGLVAYFASRPQGALVSCNAGPAHQNLALARTFRR